MNYGEPTWKEVINFIWIILISQSILIKVSQFHVGGIYFTQIEISYTSSCEEKQFLSEKHLSNFTRNYMMESIVS